MTKSGMVNLRERGRSGNRLLAVRFQRNGQGAFSLGLCGFMSRLLGGRDQNRFAGMASFRLEKTQNSMSYLRLARQASLLGKEIIPPLRPRPPS